MNAAHRLHPGLRAQIPGSRGFPPFASPIEIYSYGTLLLSSVSKENDPDLLQPADLPNSFVVCCSASFPKQSDYLPPASPATCRASNSSRRALRKRSSTNCRLQPLQKTCVRRCEIPSQCDGKLGKLQKTSLRKGSYWWWMVQDASTGTSTN